MKSSEDRKREILEWVFSQGQQFEKDSEIGEAGNSQEIITKALTQLNAIDKPDEEKLNKIIEEWKWGFKDKAPFYCDEKLANNPDIPNLRKEDMAYIFRAIKRLARAIAQKAEEWIK